MYKILSILLFAYGLAITTEDIYDNSYALIIGIDKYQNVRSLDYAVKDAEDIQSMLMDKFNFPQDNIVLLKNEKATKASIIQEFSNITKKAASNDRVLIFFAGHGETMDLPDGGEMGFLVPVDGDKEDLYVSAIKMEELKTISLLSEAKHILYLVDACYGGLTAIGARTIKIQPTPNYIQKITQYKSRQIITAGGRDEKVIEKAEWGHSAFTKNLLSGLKDWMADADNDGIITVQELGTYLKRKVTIDSDNLQTPKTRNLTTDEGEFVFVNNDGIEITDNQTHLKKNIEKDKFVKSYESWEYIRDGSRYFVNNLHAIGIGGDADRFINDGKTTLSDGFELLVDTHNGFVIMKPRAAMKFYLNPYSDYYWYFGAGVNIIIDDWTGKNNEYGYGFEPLIGIGYIESEYDGFLSKFISNFTYKGEFGYRIMPDNSNIAVKSGLVVSVKIGSFNRKYSQKTKIMPEKN